MIRKGVDIRYVRPGDVLVPAYRYRRSGVFGSTVKVEEVRKAHPPADKAYPHPMIYVRSLAGVIFVLHATSFIEIIHGEL